MAHLDYFVGQDTNGNPINVDYNLSHDDRQKAKMQEMAQLYDWNKMSYQNFYNSADQQVQRLQDAGLNPVYFLGGNAGTTPAGSGGSAGMANATGTDSRVSQLNDVVNTANNTLLATQKQAWEYDIAKRQLALEDRKVSIDEAMLPHNIKNLESTYNKNVQEVKESEQRVNMMEAEINKLVADKEVSEANAEYIKHNTAYIDQQTSLAQEMVKTEGVKRMNLKAQSALYNSQSEYYKGILEPTVKEIQSKIDVNEQEAKEIMQKVKTAMAQEDQTKANTELLRLQAELTKKYGDAEKVVSILNSCSQTWNNFWQGTKAGINAATDIVDHTPQGAALNAANSLSKSYNKTHSNPSVNPRTGKRVVSNSTK